MKTVRRIELLAPAKNVEIGQQAILHGADAVYIGAPRFGARSTAGNSIADLTRLIDFAHRFDARVYITLNTILRDDELRDAERLIHELYKIESDALIVQDMGITRLDIPPIALHASTQADNRTPEKVKFLEQCGFSQVVLARNESPYGSFDQYVKLNPYWTGKDKKGEVMKELEETNDLFNPGPVNPLYDATLDLVNQKKVTTITDNFAIEWKPWKDMTLRSRIGLTKTVGDGDNFKPAEHSDFKDYTDDQIFRRGKYTYFSDKGFSYDWDITLSYSKIFADKHEVYVGLNYNLAQSESKSYTFTMEGFPQANLKMLSMALQYEENGKPAGSESVKRRLGLTGNVNYIYDGRYFADISYRVDGASDFGSDKRFAPFYSLGLGWNINQEKFMEGIAWLDRLKLRASYAVTGSVNFSAYQALASYEYFTGDRYRYWFGSKLMGLANEDLTWQETDKWNVGLELAVLSNRLRLTADYYRNTTGNLLSEMYLPLANGFPSYTANIGEVRNTGVELSAFGYLIRNTERNIIWSLSASMVHEKNEIVKISDALKAENEELEARGDPIRISFTGKVRHYVRYTWSPR